jgi:multiple sugar transport system permease protein
MKRFLPRQRWSYIVYPLLLIVAIIGLLPYYWMVASSLKTNEKMFAYPPQWIPDPVNWQAYAMAWQAQDFTRYFFNIV